MEIDANNHRTIHDSVDGQVVTSQVSSDTMQKWIPTKNPASLVSYYAGIFGLIPFVGLPGSITAIIAGAIALKKHSEHPTPGAKVHALIGLILGSIQMILFLVFIGSMVLYPN